MDGFHHDGLDLQPLPDLGSPLSTAQHDCAIETLTQSLAAAHVAHSMDPLDAALQAQLEAPLLHPFLP